MNLGSLLRFNTNDTTLLTMVTYFYDESDDTNYY